MTRSSLDALQDHSRIIRLSKSEGRSPEGARKTNAGPKTHKKDREPAVNKASHQARVALLPLRDYSAVRACGSQAASFLRAESPSRGPNAEGSSARDRDQGWCARHRVERLDRQKPIGPSYLLQLLEAEGTGRRESHGGQGHRCPGPGDILSETHTVRRGTRRVYLHPRRGPDTTR